MITVVLPPHLRTLAQVDGDVELDVQGQITQRSVLDALEARFPALCGTIRDHVTQERRPFLRFFACEEDLSHESPGRSASRRRRLRQRAVFHHRRHRRWLGIDARLVPASRLKALGLRWN